MSPTDDKENARNAPIEDGNQASARGSSRVNRVHIIRNMIQLTSFGSNSAVPAATGLDENGDFYDAG